VRRSILKELPSLWPERFGKKEAANAIAKFIINKLENQIDAMEKDMSHGARKAVQRQLKKFIANLGASPEYQKNAADIIGKIIANPVFSEYVLGLWKELKRALESKVQQPDIAMQERVETIILGIGSAIAHDAHLHRKLNDSSEKILLSALPHFAPDIQKMIEKTVSGWSEEQIVSTLEPAVGRDLQFIRINGTIVGGLAGLAIYALSLVLPKF
jgi:uncharacterized membrane-anchored protein YjiN (DUF445 family)